MTEFLTRLPTMGSNDICFLVKRIKGNLLKNSDFQKFVKYLILINKMFYNFDFLVVYHSKDVQVVKYLLIKQIKLPKGF